MKLASVRDAEIRCSLPVMLLLPAAAALGRLGSFCIGSFSLIIHELAHAMTAERLGCRIASIELQPMGCIARLAHAPVNPAESAAIAAAGPLTSCLLALCAIGFSRLFPQNAGRLEGFISFNLGISVLNLFPVLPLDGGRLIEALLSRHIGKTLAVKLLTAAGCIFGAGLAALGIAMCITSGGVELQLLMPTITGVFIILSAIDEREKLGTDRMRFRLNADSVLRQGGSLPVCAIAMNENATVREALAALSGSSYNLILIIDANLKRHGLISEAELVSAAMHGKTEERLKAFSNMLR